MMTSSFEDERCKSIAESLKRIRENISESAQKSGRSYEDIRLMAVTKTVEPEYINYSIEHCNVDLIGENKVQEFLSKKDRLSLDGVTKHIIGHLQTNKIKKIITEVDMIQSVDSVHLAREVSKQSALAGINTEILIEVNIGGEESKTGFSRDSLKESVIEISELSNITVRGIMTIPPICDDKKALCEYFDTMSGYYSEFKEMSLPNFNMDTLSMGMSGDYREAIEHGANLVRIGSLIYGARNYN